MLVLALYVLRYVTFYIVVVVVVVVFIYTGPSPKRYAVYDNDISEYVH